ncbi:MAG: YafY family protein [Bacteroidota bacterium]
MPNNKPRLTRLTAILTQLQSKRLVTAKEIASKHDVSIRTVYRDIRTLEESGVPVVTEEGRGYSVMDGYKLPPVMFTEEEANALITAEQLLLKSGDKSLSDHYQKAVTKIKSVLKNGQKAKTEFLTDRMQVRNYMSNDSSSNCLVHLQSAVAGFQVMKLHYLSLEDQESERYIEPFALYTTKGKWILIAFCRNRGDFRSFRLDRILKLSAVEEYFEPHQMTLEQYLENCRKKSIPLTYS